MGMFADTLRAEREAAETRAQATPVVTQNQNLGGIDEATVRGLVQGGAFLIVGLLATLIWKLMRSKSEGARRLKWVLASAFALWVLAGVASYGNPMEAVALAVIVGVGYWVYRGFKKKA
jgi:chromate transport protein ChrA